MCASGARVVSRRASACENVTCGQIWNTDVLGFQKNLKKNARSTFAREKRKKRNEAFLFIREEHFIRDARKTQPKNKTKNKRVIYSDDAGDELRRRGRSFG